MVVPLTEQENTGGEEAGKMVSGWGNVLYRMKIKPFSMY